MLKLRGKEINLFTWKGRGPLQETTESFTCLLIAMMHFFKVLDISNQRSSSISVDFTMTIIYYNKVFIYKEVVYPGVGR